MVFWRTPLVGCAFFALGDVKYVLAQFVNDVPAHYVKYAPARFVNDVFAKKRYGEPVPYNGTSIIKKINTWHRLQFFYNFFQKTKDKPEFLWYN